MKAAVLESFPRVDAEAVQALLDQEIRDSSFKIVVLDDDPTGVQTVHDIYVYTDWTYDSIREGFLQEGNLFYILTNSRSFTAEQTETVHLEIGRTVARAARDTGKDYVIVSRGDSTLRGHYPLETECLKAMAQEQGTVVDGEILCPYFKEGGRFTIDNIHYVKYGDELVPAGETEFAKDKTFGYRSSDLRAYIEEKTGGRVKAEQVETVSLSQLRSLDFDGIEKTLLGLHDFGKLVVNAVDACDLKVFCVALYRAMAKGRHFMFRTAAGFVKEFGGITDRALLARREMTGEASFGGVIVVGSHTKKTTEQLERLKELSDIEFIAFNSDLVLSEEAFEQEIQRVLRREEECLKAGKTVAVYTRRTLLTLEHDTPEAALIRSVKISEAVQSLVGGLKVRPGFVIAKGGITSSDVGTKALQVKKALVLGQIVPGVPVWKTGEESRFPGIPYVIFPGNVGEADTLKEAAKVLMGYESER